jgi:solute carrier family 25 S-adenosylmethionine transporter 26
MQAHGGEQAVRARDVIAGVVRQHGMWGFYVGLSSTLSRELPFALIQFPLYDFLKRRLTATLAVANGGDAPMLTFFFVTLSMLGTHRSCLRHSPLHLDLPDKIRTIDSGPPTISPLQGALCGSVAGCIAAAATTPLDMLKTRMMLGSKLSPSKLILQIFREGGWPLLFSGIVPRIAGVGFGGTIFFGAYEYTHARLEQAI